ncbi:MAG: hypothetical protein V3R78_10140 [Thermodesulfobacteriota bacterium]
MNKKILLGTIVYDKYIDIFESVCLRSLKQKGNIPALLEDGYEIRYYIYTLSDPNLQRVKKIRIKGVSIEVFHFSEMDNTKLLHAMIEQSIGQDARLLFMSPDYFIGDGSLYNLCSYSNNNNLCIAALHMRVDFDKFLRVMDENKDSISNPQLVSLAMENLHKSWGESFIDEDSNNSYFSGSAVQKINKNLWSVSFRIPTVFLAKFERSDIEALPQFDYWDWEWPATLIDDKRYKFIGSSDMFFAVELTQEKENIPCTQAGMIWNDDFRVDKRHSEINRNFLAVLRGN